MRVRRGGDYAKKRIECLVCMTCLYYYSGIQFEQEFGCGGAYFVVSWETLTMTGNSRTSWKNCWFQSFLFLVSQSSVGENLTLSIESDDKNWRNSL